MSTIITFFGDLLDNIVCWIETGIILCANWILEGLAAVIGGLLSLLPSMPSVPSVPSWVTDGYNFVSYWFPVDFLITLGLSFVVFYVAWIVVAIVLRWAKMLSGAA